MPCGTLELDLGQVGLDKRRIAVPTKGLGPELRRPGDDDALVIFEAEDRLDVVVEVRLEVLRVDLGPRRALGFDAPLFLAAETTQVEVAPVIPVVLNGRTVAQSVVERP